MDGMEPPPAIKRLLQQCLQAASPEVVKAAKKVKTAKAELRAVTRVTKEQMNAAWLPSARVKQVAALVYDLSQNAKYGVWYVKMYQSRHWARVDRLPRNVTPAVVRDWHSELSTDPFFQKQRLNVCGPIRELADKFLMETLMYEYVLEQSRKGCTVPSTMLMTRYISAWEMRPKCAHTTKFLQRLRDDKASGVRWARTFRKNWGLRWGVLASPSGLTEREIHDKARGRHPPRFISNTALMLCSAHCTAHTALMLCAAILGRLGQDYDCSVVHAQVGIYFRWIRWLLETQVDAGQTVIMNMDETSLLSPVEKRWGICQRQRNRPQAPPQRKRLGKRCSLLALICDHPELQGHLAQVVLPRSFQKEPSERSKEMYASMGAPIEVWHLTSGFNDVKCMMQWLRRIRKQVRQFNSALQILLVFDAHPVHIAGPVLQLCKHLNIRVVIVPARLTWLLQPLDALVFQHFKKKLRQGAITAALATDSGGISWDTHMSVVGQCVHETFVQNSWASELQRMGLTSNRACLRARLKTLLSNMDDTPRPPTEEEAIRLIGRKRRREKGTWTSLLRLDAGTPTVKRRKPAAETSGSDKGHDAAPSASTSSSSTGPVQAFSAVPRARRLFCTRAHSRGTTHAAARHPSLPAPNVEVHAPVELRTGPSAGTRAYSAQWDSQNSVPGPDE